MVLIGNGYNPWLRQNSAKIALRDEILHKQRQGDFMRQITRFTFSALAILAVTGCAGKISKEDCQEANYYEMGLDDGQDGRNTERLAKYKAACEPAGVPVAEDRYNYGRQVGLVDHCDASKGKKDANKGAPDQLCMENAVPPYIQAYNAELAENRSEMEARLKKLEEERAAIEKKQAETQGALNSTPAPTEPVVQ
jgi:hypothetical protein